MRHSGTLILIFFESHTLCLRKYLFWVRLKMKRIIFLILIALPLIGCDNLDFREVAIIPENLTQSSDFEGRWIVTEKNVNFQKNQSNRIEYIIQIHEIDNGIYELLLFNSKEESVHSMPLGFLRAFSDNEYIVLSSDPDKPAELDWEVAGLIKKTVDDEWEAYNWRLAKEEQLGNELELWVDARYGLIFDKKELDIKGADYQILRTLLQDPMWGKYTITSPKLEIRRMPKNHDDQVKIDRILAKSSHDISLEKTKKKHKNFPEEHYPEKVDRLLNLAKSGDAIAQYNLGNLYNKGEDIEKNHAVAAMWFQLSAEQGFAESQASLGALYLSGKGVVKNVNFAIYWYEKAASQSHTYIKHLELAQELVEIDRKLKVNAQKLEANQQRIDTLDQKKEELKKERADIIKNVCVGGDRRCSVIEGQVIYRSRVSSPHWWYFPDGRVLSPEHWPEE